MTYIVSGEFSMHDAVGFDPGPAMKHPPRQEDSGKAVLIVEDEPILRMLIGEILEEHGYIAIEAGDAAAALRLLELDQRIGFLITDLGLPGGMDGRQLADTALRDRPGLRVLFITGYTDRVAVAEEPAMAGFQVLAKPFAMETLTASLRALGTG
jgi:CheY-like chemotaxis protein